jgi:exopolysaccharide biosynthesis polyprenyl glycosylphosphotransferase
VATAEALAANPPSGWLANRRQLQRLGLLMIRAAVPLIPVVTIVTASSARLAAPAVLAVAAGWFITLRRVFSSPWLSPLALGVPIIAGFGTLAGLGMMSIFAYWLPGDDVTPIQLLLMAIGIFILSVSVESFAARATFLRPRVLIIGAANGGMSLAEELSANPHIPFEFIGLLANGSEETVSPRLSGALGSMAELRSVLELWEPDIAVIASDENAEALAAVLDRSETRIRVMSLAHFYEHAFGRVPIETLPPIWFMSILHFNRRPYSQLTKRSFDLSLAAMGLVIFSPLLAFGALLARLSGPGPIFYRQWRLGRGGRAFRMIKFRTVVDGAEPGDSPVWALADDPRVTLPGRLMRRTRLDELPQLWNVLRGEMSIVGPRPERPEFYDVLAEEIPFWTRRNLIKPGITGWAQICRGYTADVSGAADKLAYDLFYLKHRSLVLDIAVVAKTVRALVSGAGAR